MGKTKMTEEVRNKIEQYGAEVDRLSIGGEYDKLKLLLDEMERFKRTDEEVKKDAAFNYYLGTAYGAYSDYLVRSGKCHTDSDVIELRRTSMFYLRKGILRQWSFPVVLSPHFIILQIYKKNDKTSPFIMNNPNPQKQFTKLLG